MIARGLLIGAALIAMGLLHVAGVGWLVKHQRTGADR
jgi:hypothetical protein